MGITPTNATKTLMVGMILMETASAYLTTCSQMILTSGRMQMEMELEIEEIQMMTMMDGQIPMSQSIVERTTIL